MQKALLELEEMGLIYTERTNGKFVTDNENLINESETNDYLELALDKNSYTIASGGKVNGVLTTTLKAVISEYSK